MEWWILLAAGLGAGFVSGLLGVGGGIVMTPVLHYVLKLSWADAVALSLLVIMVQSPVGLWRHDKKGAVDVRIGLLLTAGGAAGVGLGHWLLPRIDVPWLKVFFGVLMAFAAYRLVAPAKQTDATERADRHLVIIALGFAAGIVSRLLGVGGGILTVPVLVLLGVPAHLAVGSSLVPVFTNAVVASVINLVQGMEILMALPLAIGAVVAAPAGVWTAHALPEQRLKGIVALALAIVAAVIIATSGFIPG